MGPVKTEKATAKNKAVPQILLKADKVTLTATADKEGRLRINAGSWDSPVVILPGEVLEIRSQNNQTVLMRRSLPK